MDKRLKPFQRALLMTVAALVVAGAANAQTTTPTPKKGTSHAQQGPVVLIPALEPKAIELLKATSARLAAAHTLSFTAGLTFDLADAKLAAPSNVASINQKLEGDTSAVEIALIGDVDVHSFREDKNYVVDVAFQQAEKPSALLSPAPDA